MIAIFLYIVSSRCKEAVLFEAKAALLDPKSTASLEKKHRFFLSPQLYR